MKPLRAKLKGVWAAPFPKSAIPGHRGLLTKERLRGWGAGQRLGLCEKGKTRRPRWSGRPQTPGGLGEGGEVSEAAAAEQPRGGRTHGRGKAGAVRDVEAAREKKSWLERDLAAGWRSASTCPCSHLPPVPRS